jgi:hypothetical protein
MALTLLLECYCLGWPRMSSWRWRSLSRSVAVVVVAAAVVRVLVAVFFDVDRLILPVLIIFLRLDKLQ